MKRHLVSALASVVVLVASLGLSSPASAEKSECSLLGQYEWAPFWIGGPLYPGYQSSVGLTSPAYHEPFTVHGFGTTQTRGAYEQGPKITIPQNTSPGSHYVWVEQCGRKVAEYVAYVNELRPWALASKWYAPAGTTIEWDGYNFMPGERVQLFADGKDTGVGINVLDTYDNHHGIYLQGLIKFGILKYTLPSSLAGKSVLFELRGQQSHKMAQTRVAVA